MAPDVALGLDAFHPVISAPRRKRTHPGTSRLASWLRSAEGEAAPQGLGNPQIGATSIAALRQKQPFFPSRLFDPARTLYALLISEPAPLATPPKRYGGGFGGSQRTDGNAVVCSDDMRSSLAAISVGADYRSDGGEFSGRPGMRMAGGTAQHDFGRYHANAIEQIVMEFGSNSAGATSPDSDGRHLVRATRI
jgi:hypothetical protein